MSESARIIDTNGWYEVRGNPLSKVGVFPYRGSQIGAPDPDKIYMVYRPEEELSSPETLESFKLIPWVDEHAMLGSEEVGMLPAEKKGVNGVVGEEIYFQYPFLRGNIKVFSESHAEIVAAGKKELSAGYRCRYEFTPGVFEGQYYDAIQRGIRGNHMASVAAGRMGPEVHVLDHSDKMVFTLDAKDLKMPDNENAGGGEGEKEMGLKEAMAMIKPLIAQVASLQEEFKKLAPQTDVDGMGADADADKDDKDDKDKDDKKDKGMDKAAMDAAITTAVDAAVKPLKEQITTLQAASGVKTMLGAIAARDTLAGQLSPHVGTFAHDGMTLDEVAAYGVEKLAIKCEKGQEQAALTGYLTNRTAPHKAPGVAMDSGETSDEVNAFLADANKAKE